MHYVNSLGFLIFLPPCTAASPTEKKKISIEQCENGFKTFILRIWSDFLESQDKKLFTHESAPNVYVRIISDPY